MPACTSAALSASGGEELVPAGTGFLRLPAAERRALEARGRLADGNYHGCERCRQCWATLPFAQCCSLLLCRGCLPACVALRHKGSGWRVVCKAELIPLFLT